MTQSQRPPALPAAAQCYFDAVRSGSAEGVAGCFTPDGLVIDTGRQIRGRAAVGRWAQNEVIGGTYRILGVTSRGPNKLRVRVEFVPGGSSGFQANYDLDLAGGKIARANLTYA